jgi:hypothetical protein
VAGIAAKAKQLLGIGRATLLVALAFLLASSAVLAQAPTSWHDDLVDHLAGTWKMGGTVMGKQAHHQVQAEWVLKRQFLRIHEQTDANAPKDEHPYEADWYLGYDDVSERYVLHLLDVFGGRFSETLGYGTRDGNEIRFVFEYPDGPFHTTFRWVPPQGRWEWLMEQKDKAEKWTPFADLTLTKVGKP